MRLISRSGAALAALGLLCGAAALPTVTEAAKFNLNNTTKCSTIDGGLTMDPAGNITITCTEDGGNNGGGGGNPPTPTPPVCTLSANPGTFVSSTTASTTITFTANCTGSPTSYQWGNSPLSPPITPGSGNTGFTVFGPYSPPGTYAFSVSATNQVGTGAVANLTYTITAPGTVACVGGNVVSGTCQCPSGQSNVSGVCTANSGGGTQCSGNVDSFSYTGQFKDFSILKGGTASFRMPSVTLSGRHAEMIAFQSTSTPSDLQSEVAISTTCGDFNVPDICKQSGSSWSSIDLYAFSSNMGYCTLVPGTTYYVNVRNVVNNTDSCKAASCAQRLQYIGDLQ
jgi:hypothetical protein